MINATRHPCNMILLYQLFEISLSIGLATKRLRILLLGGINKIRNYLVANLIIRPKTESIFHRSDICYRGAHIVKV